MIKYTEEQVTKAFLGWLEDNGWIIVCYDFPQSGTGIFLHPDDSDDPLEGSINPDIVAVKKEKCLFFENKNRYYYPDFEKVYGLINNNRYQKSINNLLVDYHVQKIYYGIGFPDYAMNSNADDNKEMVDFILGVDQSRDICELYNPHGIVF